MNECPICSESLKGLFKITTPCDHTYCLKCFLGLLNKTCPLCRSDVKLSKHMSDKLEKKLNNTMFKESDFPALS